MALSVSLQHLSYHDAGLQGVSGAMVVLRALSHNPFCTRITLSHNQLRDEGVTALCSGILDFRKRGRVIAPLRELNLSSNGITDIGLDAVIRFLLLPSAPPQSQLPTVQDLILSSNDISLTNQSTAYLLSTALSHPSCSLVSLSFTNNIRIGESTNGLKWLLHHLEPTSLVQLQFNTCALQPDDARTIARWLSDPKKGGRLQHLELNANALGTDSLGINRIAKVVYAGLNTSLLRLELAANDRQLPVLDEEGEPTGEMQSTASAKISEEAVDGEDKVIIGDDLPFAQIKPYLSDALAKNFVLREATRHTALALLPVARIISHARPVTPSAQEIKDAMDDMVKKYAIASVLTKGTQTSRSEYTVRSHQNGIPHAWKPAEQPKAATPPTGSCPLLLLPPELITNILRAYTTIEPIPLPPNPSLAHSYQPTQDETPVFASAITDQQFARILHLAQDRSTLKGYTQRYDRRSPTGDKKDSRGTGRISLHDSHAFLSYVGCLEYERLPA